MKKFLLKHLLLVITLTSTTISASAASYITHNGIRYVYNSAKTEVSVTSLKSPEVYVGDIVVPSTITNSADQVIPVVGVGSSAFYNCTNVTSVTLPESIKTIGDYAFDSCEGLKSVTMPGVETIGHWAFRNCYALESLELPENLTSIGNFSFDKNLKITEITIPSGVTLIGGFAFEGNPQLTKITCLSSTPAEIKKGYLDGEEIYTIFDDTDYSGRTLYVPKGATDNYKSKLGWNYFPNIVEFDPSGITDAKFSKKFEVVANGNNSITISASKGDNILIVNLNGQLLKRFKASEGANTITDLPSGFIIVNGTKVLVK